MTTLEELTAEQRSALTTIVGGRLAWTPAAEAGTVEILAELADLGLVERWATMDAVTLTPWGAWLLGVEIIERIRIVGEELEEDPVWADRPATPPRLHLPRRAHEVRFPWMETFPDPLPGPEYLLDDDGEKVQLFAALFTGTGFPVEIDNRLGGAKTKKGEPPAKAKGRRRRRAG